MNNLEKALFVSPAAQPPSQLQRRAQGVVDAGLPAIAAGTQGGQHIGVKADLMGVLLTAALGRPRRTRVSPSNSQALVPFEPVRL